MDVSDKLQEPVGHKDLDCTFGLFILTVERDSNIIVGSISIGGNEGFVI